MEPLKTLKQLLKQVEGAQLKGSDIKISGIASDSRKVLPGDLFIARRGERFDGNEFIQDALLNGAKAVVTDLYDPFLQCPQIISSDLLKIEGILSAKFFDYPAKKLFCVGVTGSKGKTTTSYLCKELISSFGKSCGLLSSIEVFNGKNRLDSALTTHDVVSNQKFLKQMVESKCTHVVIEVSSHALDQNRVDGIEFDVAIFTNLFEDHLDYHGSMKEYAKAKQKLLDKTTGPIIVNSDCPWSSTLQGKQKTLSVGIKNRADIFAEDIQCKADGTEFSLWGVKWNTPLLGLFNVYNILSSVGVGIVMGESLQKIKESIEGFCGVPGRLERVQNPLGIHIFVDFAHTGDSLYFVLSLLKSVAKKRVVVVFGAGGEREEKRRLGMGKAAAELADYSIITSDNPRREDPDKIAEAIASAFTDKQKYEICIDRNQAISRAIEMARKDDIVLIAGKGHEKVQIFSSQTVSFDDVAVARQCF